MQIEILNNKITRLCRMSLMEVEDAFNLNVWSMRALAYSISVLSITFAQTSLLLYRSKASSQLPQKPCICFLKHTRVGTKLLRSYAIETHPGLTQYDPYHYG